MSDDYFGKKFAEEWVKHMVRETTRPCKECNRPAPDHDEKTGKCFYGPGHYVLDESKPWKSRSEHG